MVPPDLPGASEEGFSEGGRPGRAAARLGKTLQRNTERVFEGWPLFRGGTLGRRVLQNHLAGEARALGRLLKAGRRGAGAKAAFGGNVLALRPAVWRFVVTGGAGPTNNHAEGGPRRGLLGRKKSFGRSGEAGCRFGAGSTPSR